MIKAIDNKRVDINDEEYAYYKKLIAAFGEDELKDLFQSDAHGMITAVTPATNRPTALLLVFFFLNLMLNQRLRRMETQYEARLSELEARLKKIEK
jgi:hypothetical protein